MVDLPTTEIIEPLFLVNQLRCSGALGALRIADVAK